jgi:hypothetical protein
MKSCTVVFALLMLTVTLCLPGFADVLPNADSGCGPNGHTFNFAPLVNASLFGQANESVALLEGRGDHGNDLVMGAGEDYRPLDFPLVPNPFYYAERSNGDCVADFEGALPSIVVSLLGTFAPLGYSQVVADHVNNAFFLGAMYFSDSNWSTGVIKTTAANLLNTTNCPNGTQNNPATCWQVGSITNIVPENSSTANPSIAVDQRTHGTGASDVYAVTTWVQENANQIILSACTNSELDCSTPIVISGGDNNANYPWVQVRSDGGITISYANVIIQDFKIAAYEMKFVNCTPQGAPGAPTCSAPVLVTDEKHPGAATPGDALSTTDVAFPRHVDRLESDGKTVTTFYIYDQCAVALDTQEITQICPKTQIAMTSSTDGGKSWSPVDPISTSPGQQFLGAIALDESTETVNIAYYSSQNDKLKLRTQVFLAQIPQGQSTVGKITPVTKTPYDGPTGFQLFNGDPRACCDYIGVAAAGTGTSGQSHAYIHFTGRTNGSFNGQAFPIYTNTMTRFEY